MHDCIPKAATEIHSGCFSIEKELLRSKETALYLETAEWSTHIRGTIWQKSGYQINRKEEKGKNKFHQKLSKM